MTSPNYRFSCTQPVRWKDIDAAGVLNNAVYLTFLEQARLHYFRDLELCREDQFPFLLGETRIRYHAPARVGDELVVRARTSRLGNKSFEMDYEVCRGAETLASAGATLVWVDEDLRSMPVPEEVRLRISEFEGLDPQESALES